MKVIFTVERKPTVFAVGAKAGDTVIDLLHADGTVAYTTKGTEIDGVVEGTYTMRVTQMDVDGSTLGDAVSAALTVAANVTIDLPSGITANVLPD
jgi:hypothetical protein